MGASIVTEDIEKKIKKIEVTIRALAIRFLCVCKFSMHVIKTESEIQTV